MMAKPGESPVGRQHQSHPEETEEELREHQDGGAVAVKQEPPDPQEAQEEALQQHREQELLFRQVEVVLAATLWPGAAPAGRKMLFFSLIGRLSLRV